MPLRIRCNKKQLLLGLIILICVTSVALLIKHGIEAIKSRDFDSLEAACAFEKSKSECRAILRKQVGRHLHVDDSFTEDELLDLSKVLLIVQYNKDTYDSASKIYALYRLLFAEVVFCGPKGSSFWPLLSNTRENSPLLALPQNTRFVAYNADAKFPGQNSYTCLQLALEALPRSKTYVGALVAADDVVLNYWTWRAGHSLEQPWLIDDSPYRSVFHVQNGTFCEQMFQPWHLEEVEAGNWTECDFKYRENGWGWYNEYESELNSFYDELKYLGKPGGKPKHSRFWKRVLKNLTLSTGGPDRLFRGFTDIYYVPQKHFSSLVSIWKLMEKHGVWVESAVPTAIHIVARFRDIQYVYQVGNEVPGNLPMAEAFSARYHHAHPFKISQVFRDFSKGLDARTSGIGDTNVVLRNDTTLTCIYCYLLQMSHNYYDTLKLKFKHS